MSCAIRSKSPIRSRRAMGSIATMRYRCGNAIRARHSEGRTGGRAYSSITPNSLRNRCDVASRLLTELSRLGIKGLRMPDAETIRAWIEPGLRRQRSGAESARALSASQRALMPRSATAASSMSFADMDFAAFEAASVRARG